MMSSDSPAGRKARDNLVVFAGAIAVACGYFLAATFELMRSERIEQLHLIDMANAFTRAFAENRVDGNVIPATFRRIGIEHYTASTSATGEQNSVPASIRMPGVPGLELGTTEQNPRIRSIIGMMAREGGPETHDEHKVEQGRFVLRTVFPFFANDESCVTCHNRLIEADTYELGDMMGAVVVESDLTEFAFRNLVIACAAFLATAVCGGLLARRERRRMNRVVTALEGQVRVEQQRREAEAYANFLASHDALTGLANRTMFRDRMDQLAAEWSAGRIADVWVVVIDLDDFKAVNDSMGHDAGDALLSAVASRIKAISAETNGLAARLGGDEFAVVAAAPDRQADIADFVEELAATLRVEVTHGGYTFMPRASVGAAAISVAGEGGSDILLKAADMALYGAKAAGKGQLRTFDEEIRATMGRRARMALDLSDAIAVGGLRMVVQPQVDLKTGEVLGFEALARWNWQGEEVRPDEFIKVAEESGLILPLDLAILRAAAGFAREASRMAGRVIQVSSNISAADFADPGLSESILDVLLNTGLPHEQLTLEITETVLMDQPDRVLPVLTGLQQAGIRTALDDFGTGYSSLSYLANFPFDTIKIDRSFVRGLAEAGSNRVLLNSIVRLATDLGKTVVIEGIESLDQKDKSRELGAHIGQGFLFARPLEVEAALDMIARDSRKSAG